MSKEFERAKKMGVSAYGAVDFMAYDIVNGKAVINAEKTKLAQDAALITGANIGAPADLYKRLSPNVIEILFAPTNATKIFNEVKEGSFTDDYYQFPVSEIVGAVQPYSDFADATSSDVNFEFPVRESFRFQTAIKYGDFEVERMSVARIALAAQKQNAAATVIARANNEFYLFGVKGKALYGLLNDPNLNNTVSPNSVTLGGSARVTWADKLANGADQIANLVFADVVKLVTELVTKAGGLVDENSAMVLAMPNTVANYLNAANTYGKTAKELIASNYPNLEIVMVPELAGASGNTLYLTVREVQGQAVGECAYSEKYRLGRLIPETTSFKQKAMSATWGAIIKQPAFIARMAGV